MDFLKNNPRFDFLYNGTPFSECTYETAQTENGDMLTTVYTFSDGLQITNIAQKHGNAYEWVNWFENTSAQPSGIISALYDACITLPLPHEDPLKWCPWQPDMAQCTAVYAPKGSTWDFDEFNSRPGHSESNRYEGHLAPGTSKRYAASGGRSSEQSAPFFNIHKTGKGYIFAIGWTGQWNCELSRTEEDVTIKTKLEDTEFYLLPGEKIRTSSFVLMPYEGTVIESHNKWRKLVKKDFSLLGKEGRGDYGPLCAGIWGGMTTQNVLDRLNALTENNLPFEYLWMDAGWYGEDTQPTANEFEGDWGRHTGDWTVSPLIHTNGLKDVSEAVHNAGMKFLLWFEPERVINGTPITHSHPEYFISSDDTNTSNLVLDLGREDAWQYCFDTLSSMIADIGIDCYRQDFNMSPLPYWRKNDAEHRKGITEIKHIMGMYRLWDALLEKFPTLIIDDCASGGRRIDIETLRRSIPLWRSDYQCPANYLPEGSQCHNLSYNLWLPYSGTDSGRLYDTYCFRSSYAFALRTSYTFSQTDTFGDDPEKMQWLAKMLQEYIQVRPYMCEDFYPLTEMSDRTDVWCASQFDRPAQNDGILLIYRRENSPYKVASFDLQGIDPACTYVFTDADGGDITLSGAELAKNGFCICVKEKRTAKLYFYHKT